MKFRKCVLRSGDFRKDSEGKSFTIDRRALEHFAVQFGKMKEAGVRVFAPAGHTNSPEANQGWVEEMQVVGDELHAVFELPHIEGQKLAAVSDCSVSVLPSFVDGENRRWTNVIDHIAFVSDPVIPGLGAFEGIAASRTWDNVLAADMDRRIERFNAEQRRREALRGY